MKLLNNKYLLYFVVFLSIINILGYLIDYKFGAIAFFVLVAFICLYLTNNITIILGISLIATNLIGGLVKLFKPNNNILNNKNNKKNKKEGFLNKNKDDDDDKDDDDKDDDDKDDDDNDDNKNPEIGGTILKNSKNFQPSMFEKPVNEPEMNIELANKFENAKESEKKTDFLGGNITAGNIEEIQAKTKSLMSEQNDLMSQVADFGPILNNSLQAISNLSSGNIGSVITQLTGNLDELYAKYPDAFPSDYQTKADDIKSKMNDVNNINSEIDKYTSKDPKIKETVDSLKTSFNIK